MPPACFHPYSSSQRSVIPFGINDTNPRTGLGREEARERLGLRPGDKALLFFGQIAPYKGLNYLVGVSRIWRSEIKVIVS
jgi:hypothetical protein